MTSPNTPYLPTLADGEDKDSSALKNRIRKNYRHTRKWAKRTETDSFRIYDREIPYCPITIDFYAGRFSIQYFCRSREQEEPSDLLIQEAEGALKELFGATSEQIYWRSRIRRRKTEQYEKLDNSKEFFTVLEYGTTFKINLLDYLDTGLFLDHRETRRLVASLAKGKRLLNLFAYTCSFSVQAARAGAAYTKSVDLSNTYTSWGEDNFALNNLPLKNNPIIRADCLKFLDEELQSKEHYDLIVIDPPTLSRSKKMDQLFDIQEDYRQLLTKGLKLLSPGGTLFFSTNSRKFHFDESLFPEATIREITPKVRPADFHYPRLARCWTLQKQ